MWKSRLVIPKSKFFMKFLHKNELCFSSSSNRSDKNVIFGVITSSGLAVVGALVYAVYEPRFKHFLETNIPYCKRINKLFSGDKVKQTDGGEIYLNKIIQKAKPSDSNPSLEKVEQKLIGNGQSEDDKNIDEIKARPTESNGENDTLKFPEMKDDITSCEDDLNKTLLKLKKILEETITAHRLAASAVKFYAAKLNEALQFSDYDTDEAAWREVNDAREEKEKMLNFARKKAGEMKIAFQYLDINVKRLSELGVSNSLIKNGEKLASKYLLELQKIEDAMKGTKDEATEVAEFLKILKSSKDLFERELEIMLLNKPQDDGENETTEGDSILLIKHAHTRIEQLQEQIARLQEAEKGRRDQTQKKQDELLSDADKQECHSELKKIIENYFELSKADFEVELHQLLLRQVAVHEDHLRKSLKVQEQEIKRESRLELEEKLLNQKEAFILETSKNTARLKRISEYLKMVNESNKSSERVQALWLTCQTICYKMTSAGFYPLAKDIEKIKTIVGEDNDYVNSVIDSIPAAALNRGVFTVEILKERFEKVKDVCQKVALIDENNNSLYRYLLSYLQSILIIDTVPTRVDTDADTSKWDTFDILKRMSYLLKTGNMEKLLYYANLLKGEPKVIAEEWISELTCLLEAQLALKSLLAYAEAISIQVYH